MRFFAFHLMPYAELSPAYDGPAWVTCPNELYDPEVGHRLYNRYLDELISAYGEPFACSSALGMLRVSRAVKPMATVLLTGDGDDDLIQMPFIAATGGTPADAVGEFAAEFQAPLPDRLDPRPPDVAYEDRGRGERAAALRPADAGCGGVRHDRRDQRGPPDRGDGGRRRARVLLVLGQSGVRA